MTFVSISGSCGGKPLGRQGYGRWQSWLAAPSGVGRRSARMGGEQDPADSGWFHLTQYMAGGQAGAQCGQGGHPQQQGGDFFWRQLAQGGVVVV